MKHPSEHLGLYIGAAQIPEELPASPITISAVSYSREVTETSVESGVIWYIFLNDFFPFLKKIFKVVFFFFVSFQLTASTSGLAELQTATRQGRKPTTINEARGKCAVSVP